MDLDGLVPGRRDDGVVLAAVTDERHLRRRHLLSMLLLGAHVPHVILVHALAVALQLTDHDAREQIEDLHLPIVAADDELAVLAVERHASDVLLEDVLEATSGLAVLCIPNVY